MELTTQEVTLRFLKPIDGMALHKIGTEEYYPEGLWLAKGETEDNFEEIDVADVPIPEPPEPAQEME